MTKGKSKKKVKLIMVGIAALAMFICTMSVFYIILSFYGGLDLSHQIKENSYNMSKVYSSGGLRYYEDSDFNSVAGIDVSTYQNQIDWEKVKAAGIDFAMIRVGFRGSSSGDIVIDDKFKENIKGAKEAGLDVGVYFFSQATTTNEAIEEARYVVRHIRGKGVTYPVVFDMEPVVDSKRINQLTRQEKTEITDAFCRVIDRNGYNPMIYGNQHWLKSNLDLTYLTKYPVWLAHYDSTTSYPYEYKMWQYTHKGKVDGIDGKVDLNIYFVDK